MRECIECHTQFEPKGLEKTCSDKCRKDRKYRQYTLWRTAYPDRYNELCRFYRRTKKVKRLTSRRK